MKNKTFPGEIVEDMESETPIIGTPGKGGEDRAYNRKLIDYAQEDEGSKFRDELYAALHDRISAHIDAKKQSVAQSLISQEPAQEDVAEQKDTPAEEMIVEDRDHKVGDVVIPLIGPHRGHLHKVIHVHSGNEHFNIQPLHIHPAAVRYHLGAAKAHHSQIIGQNYMVDEPAPYADSLQPTYDDRKREAK